MDKVSVTSERELVTALQAAHAAGTPVVVVGPDGPPPGFEGTVVEVRTRGVDINDEGCSVNDLVRCAAVTATLAAGEPWDEFVALTVENEWVGIEALSGLAGTVGDVVAANEVRFGQSAADTVASVRTWDRATDAQRTFAMVDCEFAPGSSRFSRELVADGTRRYVILAASFLLKQSDTTLPLGDPELVKLLGIDAGSRVALLKVREQVLSRAK